MNRQGGIANLVSEYYGARIRSGFYREGDSLPSISKLCALFRMAPATVRSGLAQLERQGYIRIDAHRPAKVIFSVDPEVQMRDTVQYFLARRAGIQDLRDNGSLFWDPILESGLQRWDDSDWTLLFQRLTAPSPGALSMPMRFHLAALDALDNNLILNLFWEQIQYLRFPFLTAAKPQEPLLSFPDISTAKREEVILQLWPHFQSAFDASLERLRIFLEREGAGVTLPEGGDIPFQWNIYHQRPQLCYSLVAKIIQQIGGGALKPDALLPSLPNMAKQYGVSVSTVRRTVSILNSLGMTQSHQGKRARVRETPGPVDFTRPEIREGLRLYLEGLQLLALTIRPAILFTLEHTPEEERLSLRRAFSTSLDSGESQYAFELCLAFVQSHCPSPMVRECYGKLRELLAWGYPPTLHRLRTQSLNANYRPLTRRAAEHLLQEDYGAFARDCEELMTYDEQQVRSTLGDVLYPAGSPK